MDKAFGPAIAGAMQWAFENQKDVHDEFCSYWSRYPDRIRAETTFVFWALENVVDKLGLGESFHDLVETGLKHGPEAWTKYMAVYTKGYEFPQGYQHPDFDGLKAFVLAWKIVSRNGTIIKVPLPNLQGLRQLAQTAQGRWALRQGQQVLAGAPQAVQTIRNAWNAAKTEETDRQTQRLQRERECRNARRQRLRGVFHSLRNIFN